MTTEESSRPADIVFKNSGAVAELEAVISRVYTVQDGKSDFSIKEREHWLALVTWSVDGNGRTHASIIVRSGDEDTEGVFELIMTVLPFSVIMYQPKPGQTDVCLCFAKLPEKLSPRETHEAMAVPLGGAFSSKTRLAMEDAIEDMGGLRLGVKSITDLPALPSDTWKPNPFDGRTQLRLETVEGRRHSGVVAWYRGKCVVFEGTKPPANTAIGARILREDFRTITAVWVPGDGQVAATPIVRRTKTNNKPSETSAEGSDAPAAKTAVRPPRQRRSRGRRNDDVSAAEPLVGEHGPATFGEESAPESEPSAPE